jgi:hypothetical protein
VRNKQKLIRNTLIAALLILSAAICAAAQSRAKGKQNSRELPADSQTSPKHNQREQESNQKDSEPQSSSKAVEKDAEQALYSYEFTQPTFLVTHILIEHDANGRGRITFERKNSEPFVDPLELSEAAMLRIKALWDALHFLDSDRSYQSDKQYPHLGTMRLRMKKGTRDRVAEFNWTSDKDAFALITEYKRAANQAIFVFDITLARENQPLDAPKLMTQLDDYLRRNEISDTQQLVPLLRELSTDERIPLMARNHAGRLLQKIEK